MTARVLLPTDQIDLYAPGGPDSHGWVTPPDGRRGPDWSGAGALQLGPGRTSVTADDLGGRGPFAPRSSEVGTLYLPLDAPARDGWVAQVRGAGYALSQVHAVLDPTDPDGGLSAVVATVSEVSSWPV